MPTIYKPKKKPIERNDNCFAERRRIYNSERWHKLSAYKRAVNPICEMCEKKGIVRAAEDVHHIVSFMKGKSRGEIEDLAYDFNNLMSLCKECHQNLHNKKPSH